MSLSAEAACGVLFYNAKKLKEIRTNLRETGHPKQATEIITSNSTADGIIRGTIKQKQTKATDMQFYWVIDRLEQKNFEVKWKLGHMNCGDYFTKHHPPTHHRNMRQTYLVNAIIVVQERIL